MRIIIRTCLTLTIGLTPTFADGLSGHWQCMGPGDGGPPIRLEMMLTRNGNAQIASEQGDRSLSGSGQWFQDQGTLHFRLRGEICDGDSCQPLPSGMDYPYRRNRDGTLSLADVNCQPVGWGRRDGFGPPPPPPGNYDDDENGAYAPNDREYVDREDSDANSNAEQQTLSEAHASDQKNATNAAKSEADKQRRRTLLQAAINEEEKAITSLQRSINVTKNRGYLARYHSMIAKHRQRIVQLKAQIRQLN